MFQNNDTNHPNNITVSQLKVLEYYKAQQVYKDETQAQ